MKAFTLLWVASALVAVAFAVDEAAVAAKLKKKYENTPHRAFDVSPVPRNAISNEDKIGVSFFAKGSKESGRAVFMRVAVMPFPNALVARFAKADTEDADGKPSAFAAAVGLLGLVEYEPVGDGGFVPGTSAVHRRIFVRRAFSELASWKRSFTTEVADGATVYTWSAARTGAEGATLTITAQVSTQPVEVTGPNNKTRTVPVPSGFELTFAADNLTYTTNTSQWAYLTAVQTRSRPATDAVANAVEPESDDEVDSDVVPLAPEETEDSVGGELRFRRTVYCSQATGEPIQGTVIRSKFSVKFPRGTGAAENDTDTDAAVSNIESDVADADGTVQRPGFIKNGKTNFIMHSVLCKTTEGARFQPTGLLWDPSLLLADDDTAVGAGAALVPSVFAFILAALCALLMM